MTFTPNGKAGNAESAESAESCRAGIRTIVIPAHPTVRPARTPTSRPCADTGVVHTRALYIERREGFAHF
jgi:hypothetical protein